MLFNSLEFVLFCPLVFILYWLVFQRSKTSQNLLLLLASLFFYAWVDWRFLSLLLGSIAFNFFVGKWIVSSQSEKRQQRLLWLGVILNFTMLGYFKYSDFFYASFSDLFALLGLDIGYHPLHLILPLGISFFTFQNVGYLIDIYNEEIEPSDDLLSFATYISYFPKLLSGPIERAQAFLPQISQARSFDLSLAVDGCRQFLWGLFAKVVIADNCADFVNPIFDNHEQQPGTMLFLGAGLYLIQIYCDFSGYSNMAIGVSKLFGIRLSINFKTPLFAQNISAFWRRWHISLTSWIMHYLFTPLSFILRRRKKKGLYLSIAATFLTIGLWHGANWTFVVFGLLQSLYFLPLVMKGSVNAAPTKESQGFLPHPKELLSIGLMFLLMMLNFVLLRADSILQAFDIYVGIGTLTSWAFPEVQYLISVFYLIVLILMFLAIEWGTKDKEHPLQDLFPNSSPILRYTIYSLIILFIGVFMATTETDFIYFQF